MNEINMVLNNNNGGNIFKTGSTSTCVEDFRKTHNVKAYCCDRNNQGLFDRLGQKDSKGTLIPIDKQDPSVGVGFFDIREEKSRAEMLNSLKDDGTEFYFFDCPADSVGELPKFYNSPEELLDLLEFQNAKLWFLNVIGDQKSFDSALEIKDMFGKGANYIIVLNEGLLKHNKEEKILANVESVFKNEKKVVIKDYLPERFINLYENKPLREIWIPKNERLEGVENSDFEIFQYGRDAHMVNRYIVDMNRQFREAFGVSV